MGFQNRLGWNAGGRSLITYPGDCTSSFSCPVSVAGAVVGLNDADNSPDFREIEHGLYFRKNSGVALVDVVERGVFRNVDQPFTLADVFHIVRSGTAVMYYKNEVRFYTSLVPSTGSVCLDASLYSAGDTIQ